MSSLAQSKGAEKKKEKWSTNVKSDIDLSVTAWKMDLLLIYEKSEFLVTAATAVP